MALTGDIAASYLRPGRVLKRRIGGERGEAQALVTVLLACSLIFLAQWPRLARQAYLEGRELDMLLAGALLGWLFIAPLALYAMAAFSHLVARAMGGCGSWLDARMALFWGLLAASPIWLIWGLVGGFAGPGYLLDVLGLLALAVFVTIWIAGLYTVELGQ